MRLPPGMPAPGGRHRPLVSVVVPTRNRGSLLPGLLAALEAQDYPSFDLTVVDDASTDGAWEVLQSWRRAGRAALRQDEALGSYAARNRGWRASRGEIVAFTDDDCLPDPSWLSRLIQAFTEGDRDPIVAVQGMTLPGPGAITPFTHQIEQTSGGPPYRTCNIAYRRTTLEALGGFDDSLRWYADNILGLRATDLGRIAFAPDAIVHHPPRPREWRDRATWRRRFEADAVHRAVLRRYTAEPTVASALLPIILWVLRPLLKAGGFHLHYLLHHPWSYLRQMPPMLRERGAMVAALLEYWRAPHSAATLLWMAPAPLPALVDAPLVSVVVVSGRPALLRNLLDALRRQTWKRLEVVVIGTDRDGAVAAVAEVAGTRYVDAPETGLGAARQAGVEAAGGDVIAFTDDDCLPDAGWLEAMVGALKRHPELQGAQGRTEAEPGPVGSHAVRVTRPNSLFQTCNIAYRREAIEGAGGFDTRFLGWFEDTALAARVLRSGPIGFEPRALVRHRALPRRPRDRATWRRVLADERRLARLYRDFYRRTRGPGFLAGVIVHWLLGAPVKALLREAGRGQQDLPGYLRFALLLLGERIALIRALLEEISNAKSEGAAEATPSGVDRSGVRRDSPP